MLGLNRWLLSRGDDLLEVSPGKPNGAAYVRAGNLAPLRSLLEPGMGDAEDLCRLFCGHKPIRRCCGERPAHLVSYLTTVRRREWRPSARLTVLPEPVAWPDGSPPVTHIGPPPVSRMHAFTLTASIPIGAGALCSGTAHQGFCATTMRAVSRRPGRRRRPPVRPPRSGR